MKALVLGTLTANICTMALAAPVKFAVIGDYGSGSGNEAAVASLVQSWAVDFIITTGDNNYNSGQAATIDANIGQYFHSYIAPYSGSYGTGAPGGINRFFPTLGNHDYVTSNGQPYVDYFTLPGNERYYDFTWGPVHFFALDSVATGQSYGTTAGSTQGQWLRNALATATEPWKVVYLHYPPYSSSSVHGSTPGMQWPFQAWGADAVMAGHDHTYERLEVDGIPYFVNGIGGKSKYGFGTALPETQARDNVDYGAMLVTAELSSITFEFYRADGTVGGTLVDTLTLVPEPAEVSLISALTLLALMLWRRHAKG